MPHLFSLTIKNYRVLRNVTFQELRPLSVVLGPNGCGKSTLFDVIGFLGDCLTWGVRKALEPRGRLPEVRSRGEKGPLVIELKYRESSFGAPKDQQTPLVTYHLEIDDERGRPIVTREFLRWRRGQWGKPFNFLDITGGTGSVITGEEPEATDTRRPVMLADATMPAIATLGQLAENPRVASLLQFIRSWFLSYFIPDRARDLPAAGAKEHLSRTGHNLPNVAQYLAEEHPDILKEILNRIQKRIPNLESVTSERTIDNRLVLRFKDGPFQDPFLAQHVSDGTLKMLAYLVMLMDPEPPTFLCIEEPENGLHPKLMQVLVEELRSFTRGALSKSRRTAQVLVSSHSAYLVDALHADELWVMQRGRDGFAGVDRADRLQGIPEFIREGSTLGSLWFEDQFGKGNP